MSRRIGGTACDAEDLDQVRRRIRVHAEVGAHRPLDLRAVDHDHSRKRLQNAHPFLERRERVREERRPLAPDDLLQLGDRVGVVSGWAGLLLDERHAVFSFWCVARKLDPPSRLSR